MVFKLVRVDALAPSKIELTIGTHVIGRGKFLHNDATDKRVSRSHAELEVTGETVILKSLHQNPCFFIKKNTEETQLLNQDCTVSLHSGDKFGLIPDHFWYEVLKCLDLDNKDQGILEISKGVDKNAEDVYIKNKEGHEKEHTEELKNIEQNNAAAEPSIPTDNSNINSSNNGEAPDRNSCSSPSLLTSNLESTEEYTFQPIVPSANATSSPAKKCHSSREASPFDIANVKTEPIDTRAGPSNLQVSTVSDISSPAKRCHSSRESSPVDVKKVKMEPIDANPGPGPSNGQPPPSGTDSKDNVAALASPVKPSAPSRERCFYGANCYRISRRRRVTYQQLESLREFLNSHKGIAVGYNKTVQARDFAKRMWVSVSETLNSQGEGATKDWKGWSNYWVDYKAKLKRRVAILRTSQSRTGGEPSDAIPLSDLEKKFISLLGEGFGAGLPNTQVDPFSTLTQPVHTADLAAGPSRMRTPSPDIQLPLDEVPQPYESHEAEEPSPQHEVDAEEMVPLRQEEPQESRISGRVQRRRRATRPAALSQQAARQALVDNARARLLVEQQQAETLRRIAEIEEQKLQVSRDILCTLNRMAAVIGKRNPTHKVQFSHPCDPDWGAAPRGACPFGRDCRRRDPRHWAAHDHPPGAQPPGVQPPDRGAPPQGMQVVERRGNTFYINAHSVNFYDEHFEVEDSDGNSADYDYEF